MSNFSAVIIEHLDVRSETVDSVAGHIARNESCLVTGSAGSGKSHAVRRAVNGAVWVDLAPRPFTVPMFATALANQVDEAAGRRILEAYAGGDTTEALRRADQALAGRVLVVDGAEHIAHSAPSGYEEPTEILQVSETQDLSAWVRERFHAKPTVVVTSRRLPDLDDKPLKHSVPEWPYKLTQSECGYYRWKEAAHLLGNLPAGLQLAALSARLVDASRFNAAVDDLQWAEETPMSAVVAFADLAVEEMPTDWRRALAVHAAIEGAPQGLRDAVISSTPDLGTATRALTELGLIDTERGVVHVNSALARHPALSRVDGAAQLLRDAARQLHERVNDISSLRPADAVAIFVAHRLFVRLGDFDSAARTARFHQGGLIALARQVSVDGQWDEARRLYERILPMLPEPTSEPGRRTRSYVVQYMGYNGHRARTLPNGEVLSAYEESTDLWSDNALWWKRRLCLLIELGRLDEFRAQLAVADDKVPAHKRKDGLLKIPAAKKALEAGEAMLSLELLEQANTAEDPDGDSRRAELEERWRKGVDLDRLDAGPISVVLHRPSPIQLRRIHDTKWQARWLDRSVTSSTSTDAIRALAEETCRHVRRLVETPTHLLDDREVFEKGRMIGEVDLGASELGLWAARERWLLGRRSDDVFRPTQRELNPIPLPQALRGDDVGLFFARVPVTSDGLPSGPVEDLVAAGSGRSLFELLAALKSLRSAG